MCHILSQMQEALFSLLYSSSTSVVRREVLERVVERVLPIRGPAIVWIRLEAGHVCGSGIDIDNQKLVCLTLL